jgi:3-hydroxyacyl-[acyl-carrier-protein] dehydratase
MPMPAFTSEDDARIRDALRRCSALTRDAACAFRRTGNEDYLPDVVRGLIEHFVERDARATLRNGGDCLRLAEDLGVDSLTLLEIVFLAEDVLQVSIDNEDLRPCRTVGDIRDFLAAKLRPCRPDEAALAPDRPE